jgi:hypothetical protein
LNRSLAARFEPCPKVRRPQSPRIASNPPPQKSAFNDARKRAQISQLHASQSADSSPTLATIGPPNRFDT